MNPKPATAALLLLLLCVSTPLLSQEAELFDNIDVDVVNVEVFVADRRGEPVTGLGRDDFELLVDGQPVPIANFYAETQGRPALPAVPGDGATPIEDETVTGPADQKLHLTVFVDNQSLRPTHRKRAFKNLRQFLDTRLAPGDAVTVVSFNRSLRIHHDFTDDRAALAAILDEVEKTTALDFASEVEQRRIWNEIGALRNPRTDPLQIEASRSALLSEIRAYAQTEYVSARASSAALDSLLQTLSGIDGRKAVIHVGGGLVTKPGEGLFEAWRELFGDMNNDYERDVGQYELLRELRRLGRTANASRVTLYALDANPDHRQLGRSAQLAGGEGGMISNAHLELMDSNAREPLELAARTTGGRWVQMSTHLGTELERIAGDLGNYYSLGFRSADAGPGDHTIEVKSRKGLRLRHRETYRHKGRDERSGEAALATLLYNTGETHLDVTLEPGALVERADGSSILNVLVKIPVTDLALVPWDGVNKAQLSLFVSVRDGEGGARPVQKLPFHLDIPDDQLEDARAQEAVHRLALIVRPGDLQAVVGVRDDFAAQESAVRLELGQWSGDS